MMFNLFKKNVNMKEVGQNKALTRSCYGVKSRITSIMEGKWTDNGTIVYSDWCGRSKAYDRLAGVTGTALRKIAAVFCLLMVVGVGDVWGWTSRQTGTISSVYVSGDMNEWATDDSNWALIELDNNHWKGDFIMKGGSSDVEFKLYIDCDHDDHYSTGYTYHSGWTGGEAEIYSTGKGNAKITPASSSTDTYIGVSVEFYSSYGTDSHGFLKVSQKVYGTSLFTNSSVLYLDADGITSDARFAAVFLKGDGGNQTWVDMTQVGATNFYYVNVPASGSIPGVIFCRMNASQAANNWDNRFNQSADLVPDAKNCYDFTSYVGGESKLFNGTWNYYRPPMSSVTLSDNGTTLNWGGNGGSSNPYLIPTSSTIKLSASSTSSVTDANMTAYYRFYDGESALGSSGSSTNTRNQTASASNNTTHTITVRAYNHGFSANGAELTSNVIYYQTRTPYTISYNKGTGGTGTRANETKLDNVSFTLPNSAVFNRTGYTHTGWTTNDLGSQSYALGGSYTTNASQTFYPVWTAKTTTVTLDPNTANHGTGSNRDVTATYDSGTLTSFVAATPETGYYLIGYYTSSDEKIINADGTLVRNTTYTTDAATPLWKSELGSLTLYAHYDLRWIVAGDMDEWATESHLIDNIAEISSDYVGYVDIDLSARTTYELKMLDRGLNKWHGHTTEGVTLNYTNSETNYAFDEGYYNLSIRTAQAGTYRFTWNITDGELAITYPATAYAVTYDANGADHGSEPVTDYYASGETVTVLGNIGNLSKAQYHFTKWNTASNGDGTDYNPSSTFVIYTNMTLYAKWAQSHTITFVNQGETVATIYRSDSESLGSNPTDQGDMPVDPADNTLSSCGLDKFVGWSATDIGGDAITSPPSDLFSNASAEDIFVNDDATFYAVFGDAPDNGMALARTVLWSEDWTGEAANATPIAPTSGGGYTYGSATIRYECSDGSGTISSGGTKIYNESNAGGIKPELMVKGNTTTAGSLYITGLRKEGAKELSLTFKRNNSITKALSLAFASTDIEAGYAFKDNSGSGAGIYEYTITCGSAETFSLYFNGHNASSPSNTRIDDIVLRVKKDGATTYRTYCPELEVTAYPVTPSTPFFITSSANKTVRSQDSVRIVGHHLTKNGAVSISTPSSKFVLKSRTNGAITTDANGDIDTYAYIYYTPDAEDTEDGLDKYSSFTISVAGNGGIDVEVDQELIGRHLPEDFVIAVKKNGTWYALPANMTNSTPSPVAISVDNEISPTKVITSAENVYSLRENVGKITTGDGQYVRLAMHGISPTNGEGYAPLQGGSDSKLGQSGTSGLSGILGKAYWWKLVQQSTIVNSTTDVKYHLYCPNNSNSYHVRLYTSSGNEKWGQYANHADSIRIIPYLAGEMEATVSEWSDGALLVTTSEAPSSVSATKIRATVGETSSSVVTLADNTSTSNSVLFSGVDFSGKEDEKLTLEWLDNSEDIKAATFVTIPSIIATTATTWDGISPTPSLNDVVVLKSPTTIGDSCVAKQVVLDQSGENSGELDIPAGKRLVVAQTIRKFDGTNFGATETSDITINSDKTNGLGTLVMGEHDGTNGATVNFYSKSYYDSSNPDNSPNQYVGTPFGNRPPMIYQFYNSWMYKFSNEDLTNVAWERINGDTPLEAFQGYCVISAENEMNDGHMFTMSGQLVASDNVTNNSILCRTTGGAGNTNYNNENMLANSWMAPIKINAFDILTDFNKVTGTIYIFNTGSYNDYNDEGTSTPTGAEPAQYSTYTIGTAANTDVIPPMQAFSVYAYGDNGETGSITLDYKRLVYDPAVAGLDNKPNKAPRRASVEQEEANKMRMYVRGESGYGDMLYMWEHENFHTGFENGWDGGKLYGEDVAPQLYAITEDGKMAVNCVPSYEGVQIGFKAGTNDAAYTFTFEYEADADVIYLHDKLTGDYTRVVSGNSYMFGTTDKDDHARFELTRKAPQVATGDVTVSGERSAVSGEAFKFVEDDRLLIYRDGKVYNATGVIVR